MHANLHVIDMEATITDLIELLASIGHTSIPVLDSNANCFGIISAIDVFRFLATGGNPNATKSWEICSHSIIQVPLEFEMLDAAKLMLEHQIHHLIICNAGRVEGVLSSLDDIKFLNDQASTQ